jgi:holo-[acyl-carrier protein] synthase
MIYGVGIDIVKIDRIRKSVQDHGDRFLEKIYTEGEIAYCRRMKNPYPSLAVRFAAKEAAIKALSPQDSLSFRDIEVLNDEKGKPELNISGRLGEMLGEKGIRAAHLSLSHEKDYGVAFVVFES